MSLATHFFDQLNFVAIRIIDKGYQIRSDPSDRPYPPPTPQLSHINGADKPHQTKQGEGQL